MKKNLIYQPSSREGLRIICLTMKITFLLLFVPLLSLIAAKSYSQNNINIRKTKSVSAVELVRELKSQSEYMFFYIDSDLANVNVSLNSSNNTSVTQVLDEALKDTQLTYTIQGNHISIHKQNTATQQGAQQKETVSGIVVDSKGEELIGVSVMLDGTKTGTVTDIDGRFTLSVSNLDGTITLSYIGYTTQKIQLKGRREFKITLQESADLQLDEVVVVGYGSQRKGDMTGAIASIGSEVLEDRPLTSVGAGLQGAIPNLNITMDNGQPGQSAKFNIRGTTNLDGASPLVLVDGVEMDIDMVNPSDIADIVVLKDAASSAIYGARAAFGVVLITTKQGTTTSKPRITFNASYSINKPTVTPTPPNSLDYANWMNAANYNTGSSTPYFDDETMQYIEAYYNDPYNNPSVFVHSKDTPDKYTHVGNTNWYKELNNTTYPIQKYDVGIQGGSKDVKYFTSAALFKQGGMARFADEDFKRYNVLQNVTYQTTSWMEVGLRASLSVTDRLWGANNKYGASSTQHLLAGDTRPLMPVYYPDGNFSNGGFTNSAAWGQQGGSQKTKRNEMRATGTLKLTPFKDFVVNADYTYNYLNSNNKNHRKEFQDYDAIGNPTPFPHTSPNAVSHTRKEYFVNVFNVYAEYQKSFDKKHNFKLMGGYNEESRKTMELAASRNNLIINDIPSTSLATGERSVSDSESKWTTRGAFFRLNYDYEGKYLFQFNGRYDGSSRFPKHDRFKFYPSFSAGWRVSAEKFWMPIQHIANDFKLRGSYGSLGNQAVESTYPYIPSYGSKEVNYLFGGKKEMGIIAPGLVSPTLTWETVDQYDIGFDLHMLDSKLTATFDYYSRTTKDMLTKSKTLPSILGVDEPKMNAADLRTDGWELTLAWRQQLTNDLNFNATFILSDYTSKITKFDNPTKNLDDHYVGKKMGEIWGFVTDGLFASDAEASAWDQSEIVGYTQGAGDIKFADLDGKPGISKGANTAYDPGDRKIIGNSTPRYSYGIRTGADWKGFDVTIFFQGIGKREVQANNNLYLNHYTSEWSVPQQMNMDYWRPDNTNAFYPRARFNGGDVVTAPQTRYLLDASYIRLKQLAIGYTIPKAITERAGISKVRVYFNADNLWEHSNLPKGFDPEIAIVNAYPFMRSFTFGLNVAF